MGFGCRKCLAAGRGAQLLSCREFLRFKGERLTLYQGSWFKVGVGRAPEKAGDFISVASHRTPSSVRQRFTAKKKNEVPKIEFV